MIELLAKRLIPSRENTKDSGVRRAYGMLCGFVGVALNVLLFAIKYLAGTLAGSIAVTADAFNNLSDAGSSVVTLLGFRLAGKRPDADHPFGHGRFEYISGLIVAFLILHMGFDLLGDAIDKIRNPEAVEANALTLVILGVSIAVKLYMAAYNRRCGRMLDSSAMKATASDCLSDSIATAVVMASTVIGLLTPWQIDGWCGLLVAGLVLWAGYNAAKDTIDPLLGQAPSQEFVEDVRSIVHSYPQVCGIHDLIVHDYGPGRQIVSLHAEVPADADVLTMHDTVDNIERELAQKLGCMAVVHMDPVMITDEKTRAMQEMVRGIVRALDERLTIHDFRVVAGPTHTNLIFDVVVPVDFEMKDSEVVKTLSARIREENENCFAVISVDKSYVL